MKGKTRKGHFKDAAEVRASRAEARAEKRSASEIICCLGPYPFFCVAHCVTLRLSGSDKVQNLTYLPPS